MSSAVGFLSPFSILYDLDPLKPTVDTIMNTLGDYSSLNLPCVMIRILLTSFCSLGLSRAMSFAVTGLVIGEIYLSELLDGIIYRTKNLPFYISPTKFRDLCFLYTRMILIIKKVDNMVTPAAAGLMSGCFCLLILSNLVTIRFSSVVPMPFYLVFPALSFFLPLCMSLMVPKAIRVFEESNQILRKWKIKVPLSGGRVGIGYRVKCLRALRPCRLHVGLGNFRFFYLQHSTLRHFYGLCVFHTINVLLSVSL
jgi:hypothetical protein